MRLRRFSGRRAVFQSLTWDAQNFFRIPFESRVTTGPSRDPSIGARATNGTEVSSIIESD